MKKHYYHSFKPYVTRKRVRPLFKTLKGLVKIFFPKDELVWTDAQPAEGESTIIASNHTQIYAPIFYTLYYNRPKRLWANGFFLHYDLIWKHIKNNVLTHVKHGKLLYPVAILLIPAIVWAFRSLEPVPVYHIDKRVVNTYNKALETAEEGLDQIIFPETTAEMVNPYVHSFNRGFVRTAKYVYEKTGKRTKFYPAYCCPALHKTLIGKPIEYNPDMPYKQQKELICKYLENEICTLGDSLPPHKPAKYG